MAIRILKRFFETTDQVLDDIKRTGFWPTTLIAPVTYIVALPEPRPFGEFLTLLPPESAPASVG